MRFVLDAQPLAIKTIHALRYINVLTVTKTMHRITKNAVFINESDIQHFIVSQNVSFFEARAIYFKNSWTESDELCWDHRGSDPVHISMYTD